MQSMRPPENTMQSMWPAVLCRFPILVVRAFALEAGRLGSILSRVQPKTLKLVSAVTLLNAQQLSVAQRMK